VEKTFRKTGWIAGKIGINEGRKISSDECKKRPQSATQGKFVGMHLKG